MEKEKPFSSKPIIASNMCAESLEKYKEEISTLPQENDVWTPFLQRPLCSYQGFWFHSFFLEGAMYAQDHFKAQPDDIFLCSSIKTGCTWLKALSFSIATRTQFDDSMNPLRTTVPHDCIPFLEFGEYSIAPGPRIPLFASHLPYTCLPKSIIESGCKIVYLCRDPKDTLVSMWHFCHKIIQSNIPKQQVGDQGDLVPIQDAFEFFCKGIYCFGPYWEHVLGYWKASLESPDKILFLKYEDMKKDTQVCVKKLAEFFGCPFSLEEERQDVVHKIIEFCCFERLSNLEVNKTGKQEKKGEFLENSTYFRKGKVGDWRNYLTVEMGMCLDNIMEEKLSHSGLTFLISPDE